MFPRIPKPEMETFPAHRHDWQGRHEGIEMFKIKIGSETVSWETGRGVNITIETYRVLIPSTRIVTGLS